MNEVYLTGKVVQIYPMKQSENGYDYVTFLLKTAKFYKMGRYCDDDEAKYIKVPIIAWRKLAQRVSKDLKPGKIIFVRAHVAVFETKNEKGASYLNPKITLDGYTPNYDLKMAEFGKSNEEIRHECLALMFDENDENGQPPKGGKKDE